MGSHKNELNNDTLRMMKMQLRHKQEWVVKGNRLALISGRNSIYLQTVGTWKQLHIQGKSWSHFPTPPPPQKNNYMYEGFNTHRQKFIIWMIIPVKNNSNDKFLARA